MKSNKIIIFSMFLLLLSFSCSKSKNITFCEGVDPKGNGVKCGTKFLSGDLTAIIKSDGNFETNKIIVQVFEAKTKKKERLENISVDVKPVENKATVQLSFYREGFFKVIALRKEKEFADGDIEIVE